MIPRFSRYLRDVNGWSLTSGPDYDADAIYLSGYFEVQMCKRGWPSAPVAAYFTHREAEGDGKAKLFDRVMALNEAVKVDVHIPGCPPPADAIWFALTELLAGRIPELKDENLTYE